VLGRPLALAADGEDPAELDGDPVLGDAGEVDGEDARMRA